ncbi:MAG: peptidase [Pseudomonadota bacterium]
MTYCLATKLEDGLVFCSDSRTNAGPDLVSTFSKMHRFSVPGERHIVLLSAGNLATSQAVIDTIKRDVKEQAEEHIHASEYLTDIADYVGRLSLEVQNKYAPAGEEAGFNAEATFILGGQLAGEEPGLYLIYAEGNHIRASSQHPYLQIGETKYGKPILDRIIEPATPYEVAMRCALVSMDSTMRSNATVGPPIELLFLPRGDLSGEGSYHQFEQDSDYLIDLREAWNEKIVEAFNDLPSLDYLL